MCPVNCIHGPEDREGEGEEAMKDGFNPKGKQLYINPEECIDTGLSEPEFPVDAIRGEDEADPYWLEMNAKLCYEDGWEMIDEEKPPMEGYEEAAKIENKTERLIKHVQI